jgi:hypothetical protein
MKKKILDKEFINELLEMNNELTKKIFLKSIDDFEIGLNTNNESNLGPIISHDELYGVKNSSLYKEL